MNGKRAEERDGLVLFLRAACLSVSNGIYTRQDNGRRLSCRPGRETKYCMYQDIARNAPPETRTSPDNRLRHSRRFFSESQIDAWPR